MKLFSTLVVLFVNGAKGASVKCMASEEAGYEGTVDESPIKMIATVNNDEIKHDLTEDPDWSCIDQTCTRSWDADEFTGSDEKTFDSNNLILKKTIVAPCKSVPVDDVNVCVEQGHNLEFVCKYPLGTQEVASTYNVAGHDTNIAKEGTGTLNFKLKATEAVNIGDPVTVEIEAINQGLVYHALQDCQVTKGDQSVSILNWSQDNSNLSPVCPNVLGVNIIREYSQTETTKFSWTAFKWSTSSQENDKEVQTITCTISLSENAPTVNTPDCSETEGATTTTTTTTSTTTTKEKKTIKNGSIINGFVVMEDTNCFDRDLSSLSAPDIETCIEQCQKINSCNAVTWLPNQGNKCAKKGNWCKQYGVKWPGMEGAISAKIQTEED